MERYEHKKVEDKWRKKWIEANVYKTTQDPDKEKFYILDMFPYPSGAGLHVGHPKGYIATDIISRYKKMNNFNVLHPMGWDAFGLPAEQHALKNKVHPRIGTDENIKTFKKQLEKISLNYDWEREIATTDPEFYKWTQWAFIQMYKKGLVYQSNEPINWCPSCKTGLANEDLENGACERCDTPIQKKKLPQWVIKITDYADRLLEDLDKLDWQEHIKELQRNWIGRSEGAEIEFKIKSDEEKTDVVLMHGFEGRGDQGWFSETKHFLEQKGLSVYNPDFPNSNNPSYIEWKKFFDNNVLSKINKNTIFIAHSLAPTFLIRYLSENDLKLNKVLFVAPAIRKNKNIPEIDDFFENFNLQKVKKSINQIIVIYSNDPYIPKEDFEYIIREADAEEIYIENKEHFTQNENTNPEILDILDEKLDSRLRGNDNSSQAVKVFTTRPDTLYGATYMVLAPEHELVNEMLSSCHSREGGNPDDTIKSEDEKLDSRLRGNDAEGVCIKNVDEVRTYQKEASKKTEIERTAEGKEKTGVRLEGVMAVNPVNGEEIPIFIADYVLADYGTGAIMAVPAHDERDFEFAQKYNLPIKMVIQPFGSGNKGTSEKELEKYYNGSKPWITTNDDKGNVILINSSEFDGVQNSKEIKEKITKKAGGKMTTSYKLRDWVFSRQRYWGEPIPLIHCDKCGVVTVPEDELPLELPEVESYEPTGTGESPLAAIDEWVNTTCPECGGDTKRETNTMPQWAGSSWYYLRYIDPKNDKALVDKDKEKYWSPVDFYVGGAEHATRHLIYARFWHKFLYDIGVVNYDEPFSKLQTVGLIMAEDGRKMSKRWGNVINPDDVIERFGSDTFRLYEMFMGPFDASIAWSTEGLVGPRKFLEKIWKSYQSGYVSGETSELLKKTLHKTIKKVGEDIGEMKYNTAISAMMVLANQLEKKKNISTEDFGKFLKILSPFAPHMTQELWSQMGNNTFLIEETWPKYDEKYLSDDEITLVVQVNGKVRDKITVNADITEDEAKEKALESEKVQKHIGGKEIRKVIFVQGKLISIVV